ncbi:expressed unknown protein [Seminavis robusta]|uniref:Uncharacterized protein n=1 Tax=Seminavis robusta TaxID=568900 RepID=A0A9N8EP11_9STRA|nr:expressed unknown protein [Seminavis robusta]|eukprot:Sro1264_g257380.1 n/a (222) ;mRNA; f:24620-25285
MCRSTTATVPRRMGQPSPSSKKRPRQVQFAKKVAQVHVVENIATPYSQRWLWYNKQELQRAQFMDLRRNMVAPDLVDTPHGAPDLTWRGLEQHKPKQRKLLGPREHVRAVLDVYRNQRYSQGTWVPEDLRNLSEALSCDHRLEAMQRAWHDQKMATSRNNNKGTATNKSLVRSASGRRRSSGTSFGMHRAIQRVPMVETFLWLMRVVTFFLLCGLLFATHH